MLHFSVQAEGKRLGKPRKAVNYSRIASLRRSGASWEKVGDALGVSDATVRRAMRKPDKNPPARAFLSVSGHAAD